MNVTVKLEVKNHIWDLDLYFWLNDDIQNRHFRNCSNNKDTFEVDMGEPDILYIDTIIYAQTNTAYSVKYSAQDENGQNCSTQSPASPIENTVQEGNNAHELITVKR